MTPQTGVDKTIKIEFMFSTIEDYKRLSLRKTFFGEPPNESLLNEDKKKRKTSEDSELIEAEFYEDLDVGDNVAEGYIATRDFLVGGFHEYS